MAQPTLMPGRKLTQRLYRVTGDGAAASWTPVGGLANKDGNGFSVRCDAVPLQGRIIMHKIIDRAPAGGHQ